MKKILLTKRVGLVFVFILKIVAIIVFCSDSAWAARNPHQLEVYNQLPVDTKVIQKFNRLVDAPGIHWNGAHGIEFGNFKNKEEVIDAVESYLSEDPDGLRAGKVSMRNLGVDYYMEVPATENHPAMIYVQMGQYYKGRKVLDAGVKFSIKKIPNGSDDVRHVLMLVKSQLIPESQLRNVVVTHNTDPLRMKAEETLALPFNSIAKSVDHIIVYDKDEEQVISLFEVVFEDKSDFSVYVREDSRKVYGVKDNRHYVAIRPVPPIRGDVQGRGVIFDPLETGSNLDQFPLKDLELTLNGVHTTFTEENGRFAFPGLYAGFLQGELEGRWVDVSNNPIGGGTGLSYSANVVPGAPVHIVFNDLGVEELSVSQVNAYYHTTNAHDWIKERLPSFTPLDFQLPAIVNGVGVFVCNAYYSINNPSINFFQSGSIEFFDYDFYYECINTAFDTIIQHEYGHFFDDMAGGIPQVHEGQALSEGWGDVLAAYVSGQPLIGEGWNGPGAFMRSADNDYLYPTIWNVSTEAIHALGQAWAGFAWDFRADVGESIAEDLLMSTMLANSQSIPEALLDLMIIDDNDGNLNNGTPNDDAIIDAAVNHRIYPFPDQIVFIDQPYDNQIILNPGGSPVNIVGNTDCTPTGFNFSSYQLFYGAGINPITWTAITPPINMPTNGNIGSWDMTGLTDGTYTLRLVVDSDVSLVRFEHTVPVHINSPWNPVDIDFYQNGPPDKSGDKIVWWKGALSSPDVFMFDIPTGNLTNISNVNNLYDLNFPSIDGDLVVWKQGPFTTEDIYLYDINNPPGSQQNITNNALGNTNPDISGYNIAWNDYVSKNVHYCIYDPVTGNCPIVQVSNDPGVHKYVAISGNHIVWQNFRTDWDIYYHNIVTGITQKIVDADGDQKQVAISGDLAVYMDDQNGDWDIVGYNVVTGQTQVISNDPGNQTFPAIFGDWVVWIDESDGTPDVHARNLVTGQFRRITDGNYYTNDMRPDIDGTTVIWQSDLGGFIDSNIFSAPVP